MLREREGSWDIWRGDRRGGGDAIQDIQDTSFAFGVSGCYKAGNTVPFGYFGGLDISFDRYVGEEIQRKHT